MKKCKHDVRYEKKYRGYYCNKCGMEFEMRKVQTTNKAGKYKLFAKPGWFGVFPGFKPKNK